MFQYHGQTYLTVTAQGLMCTKDKTIDYFRNSPKLHIQASPCPDYQLPS